jgi:hypothetical protein
MKTTYWLVTAAAVAAFVLVVYAQLPSRTPPLPDVPVVASAPPEAPRLELPPVVLPPDEPPAMPVPDAAAVPPALPAIKTDPSVVPVSARERVESLEPLDPPVSPTLPVPLKVPAPAVPAAPAPAESVLPEPPPVVPPAAPEVPPAAVPAPEVPPAAVPAPPVVPPAPVPVPPVAPPGEQADPVLPAPPAPTPAVAPPVPLPPPAVPPPPTPPPVPLPPPAPAPAKSNPVAAGGLAPSGRYAVMKNNKLLEGEVSVRGDTVNVHQGAVDTLFKKDAVQFVGSTRDEVYRFVLATVSAADAPLRLHVARWCMFNGMREQALTEAREVHKLARQQLTDATPGRKPDDVQQLQATARAAADMVRSLELSLQQFPPDGGAPKAAAAEPARPADLRAGPAAATPEPLAPLAPPIPPAAEPDPEVTPEAALVFGSRVQPFLENQCAGCHGSAERAGKFKLVRVNPAEAGPQSTRTNLRAVAGQLKCDDAAASPLLVKALVAHGGMKRPAVESRRTAAYLALEEWVVAAVVPPAPIPPVSPVVPRPEVLPPPAADPIGRHAPAVPSADPLPPPVEVLPAAPALPAAPPVPVMPTPPATAAPKPSRVVPVGGPFGTAVPPKPPATGPAGGDEFDPAGFNRQPPK